MIKGLRDYQVKALNETYRWLAQNKGNPCIVAPTGSGKAWICAGLCEDIIRHYPNSKILVLSHVKELLVQDADKILQVWPEAPLGIYSAGLGSKDINTITVAGIQSIWKKGSELGHIDLVIVDEAHLISNTDQGMYRTLISDLKAINPRMRVIGLTATPYRLGQGILTEGDEAIFNALIESTTIEELVNRGYLARLTSTFTDMKMNVEGIKKVQGDYEKHELEERVNSQDINAKVAEETIRRAGDRRAWLVFCVSITHAEALRDEFIARGINAASVSSKTSASERERIFSEFKSGEIRALTNVVVATTGFDYPDIDVIVMARPTLSPGLFVQMSGRGMRVKSPGHHRDCLVLDFAGNIERHGPLTKIIPPRRSIERKKKVTQEDLGDMFKLCPKCKKAVLRRARECPNCGHQFSELKELNTTQDIMGTSQEGALQRMEVRKWYWRTASTKRDPVPYVRVDFYGEDMMKGPKQLILKFLHGGADSERAYKNLRSLLQGVKIPGLEEINTARALHVLADTVMKNYEPPSWVDYRQNGIYANVTGWGWEAKQQ